MIDLTREKLIPISQAAELIPRNGRGQPTHVSTLIRWIHQGSRGRRLDALRVGGSWFTSVDALARFAEHPLASEDVGPAVPAASQSRARLANKALDELGL